MHFRLILPQKKREQSDLCQYCLQYRLLVSLKEHMTFVTTGGKRAIN